jgi:hypothetical protein
MTLKLLAGLLILFIALTLQFWFASVGWSFDLSFAALISFAFIFDFWELLVLIFLAVFIVNWQPRVSLEILIFGLYPIVLYFSKGILHWQVWLENAVTTFLGFLILYLIAGHGSVNLHLFLPDVVAGMIFGALIFVPLYRWGRQ